MHSIDVEATEEEISRALKKSTLGVMVLDDEGRVSGTISAMDLLNLKRPKISLVDHSERGQSVDGLADAELIEIIDHHRLGDVETIQPLYIDVRPLGSTASILYERIKEADLQLIAPIAKLLLGALISDTLLLTSPTCTESDRKRAKELAEMAEVDLRSFGIEVLRQNDELTTASPEKLVRRDCKHFAFEGQTFLAAQIETVDLAALTPQREQDLLKAFSLEIHRENVDFGALMITDVLQNKSWILIVSEDPKWTAIHIPKQLKDSGSPWIEEGFVSRKKQLIPLLLNNIKQAL
jgi:Inorganic pyrophosphatase/exopolyphosphatase